MKIKITKFKNSNEWVIRCGTQVKFIYQNREKEALLVRIVNFNSLSYLLMRVRAYK